MTPHSSCPCEDCRKIVLGVVGIGVVMVLFIFMSVNSVEDSQRTLDGLCGRYADGMAVDIEPGFEGFYVGCQDYEVPMSWYVLNISVVS